MGGISLTAAILEYTWNWRCVNGELVATQKLFNTSLNEQPGFHIYLCEKTLLGPSCHSNSKFTGAAGALESAK